MAKVSQDCQLLSSYGGISEGKELLIDQYHHRLEVYALHVIIPTIDVNSCTTLV